MIRMKCLRKWAIREWSIDGIMSSFTTRLRRSVPDVYIFYRRILMSIPLAMSRFRPSFRGPPAFCALDTSSWLLVLTLTGSEQCEETQIRKSPPASRTDTGISIRNWGTGQGVGSRQLLVGCRKKYKNALVPHTIPLLFVFRFHISHHHLIVRLPPSTLCH